MRDRLLVRDLFLRSFGLIVVAAFWSLWSQVDLLLGRDGLVTACANLDDVRATASWWSHPTVFWLTCDDRAFSVAAGTGLVAGVGLVLGLAPRWCLVAVWGLYLSFVTIGSPFFNFQWDNLLIETSLVSVFVAPAGIRRGRATPPHPISVFLMLWLLFRLHFESGAAKLMSMDPTWRDLTALVAYYETAPLPTWLGWHAHQFPLVVHQFGAAMTLVVELILPWFYLGPSRLRRWTRWTTIGFQVVVLLTANYGIFNYLSLALCLFLFEDSELRRWFGGMLAPKRTILLWRPTIVQTLAYSAVALLVIPLSLAPFFRFANLRIPEAEVIARAVGPFRTFNVYHLFASMTLVRREAVIEGSDDGDDWQPYEFRFKPGDPNRAPGFIAPLQPRVDFQLWFLLLGDRWGAPYFDRLLSRLQTDPRAMRPLFAKNPFPTLPPRFLRVVIYQYKFSDAEARRLSGAWWERTLISTSGVRRLGDVPSPPSRAGVK